VLLKIDFISLARHLNVSKAAAVRRNVGLMTVIIDQRYHLALGT
jgi:hypothetical protein